MKPEFLEELLRRANMAAAGRRPAEIGRRPGVVEAALLFCLRTAQGGWLERVSAAAVVAAADHAP